MSADSIVEPASSQCLDKGQQNLNEYSLFKHQCSLLEKQIEQMNLESNKLDLDQVDVCMYHGSCSDGFGSAFVVYQYFKTKYGEERAKQIEFIPCYFTKPKTAALSDSEFESPNQHQQQQQNQPKVVSYVPLLPESAIAPLVGKRVVMCDFSYKKHQLWQILSVCSSFLILDHHKSAVAELQSIPPSLKRFRMDLSGVGITYDAFFPGKELPLFLQHVQYQDLGHSYNEDKLNPEQILPNNKSFIAYFHKEKQDFEVWEKYLDDQHVNSVIQIGEQWLAYRSMLVKGVTDRASCVLHRTNQGCKRKTIFDQKCTEDNDEQLSDSSSSSSDLICVAYSNNSDLQSDVGNALLKKYRFCDFSAVFSINVSNQTTTFSLRSETSREDVQAVAVQFGGGGHPQASGFNRSEINPYIWPLVDDYGLIGLLCRAQFIDWNSENSIHSRSNNNNNHTTKNNPSFCIIHVNKDEVERMTKYIIPGELGSFLVQKTKHAVALILKEQLSQNEFCYRVYAVDESTGKYCEKWQNVSSEHDATKILQSFAMFSV